MEEVVEWLEITKTQKKRSPEYDEMRIEAPALALVCGDDGGHPVPVPRHKELARGGGPAIGVMAAVVTSVWSHLNRHRDWAMKTDVSLIHFYQFTRGLLEGAWGDYHGLLVNVEPRDQDIVTCQPRDSGHMTRAYANILGGREAFW